MRVARLHGRGDLRLHDEPEPVPGLGEELVRITSVGLCGSDRHWFLDGAIGETGLARPLVLGHEIAAVIAAGPRAGTRVVVEPADACGTCSTCRAGQGHLCPSTRFAGHGTTDGGLRTAMAWPARLLSPIPDGVTDDDAALLEPLGVALHAIDLAHVGPDSSVAVIGCGPIGLLIVQVLAARGCGRIVAVEPLAHRRAAAVACGATVVSDQIAPDQPPVDVSFEVCGEDPAIALAVDAVRPGGRVVLVGIPATATSAVPAAVARRKGLSLLWSRRMAATALDRAIELVSSGAVRPGRLISARYSLDDAPAAFAALVAQDGLKLVVGAHRERSAAEPENV